MFLANTKNNNNIMQNAETTTLPNFFQSEFYTEFFIHETLEVWLFGDHYNAITENTPRIHLGTSNHWDTSALIYESLPTTDGHGCLEYKSGYVWEGLAAELSGTTYEHIISERYNLNAHPTQTS